MKKPKIAVLIDWYLPGTKAGGPVRSAHSLLSLLKDDFDFYVITLNRDLGSKAAYQDIVADRLFEREGISYYYFSPARLSAAGMLNLLREINPDLVYLNSFWSFGFSISVVRLKQAGSLKKPVLLAPRGMLGKGALGLKAFKKRTYLTMARLFGWYRQICFHASQEQEKKDILKEFPLAKVYIAPNINSAKPLKNLSRKKSGELRLFFLSRISEVKNLHYALEILRDVPSNLSITYDIFGNTESADYWARCSHLISLLPANVEVNLKGEIPFNQVQGIISGYHALFLPTLNENYGHSIVESLLCGCQVLISDQTPWSDVEQRQAGYALPLSDRKGFLRAIQEMAEQDETAFGTHSEAAINYISEKIDLEQILIRYKQLFHACIHH